MVYHCITVEPLCCSFVSLILFSIPFLQLSLLLNHCAVFVVTLFSWSCSPFPSHSYPSFWIAIFACLNLFSLVTLQSLNSLRTHYCMSISLQFLIRYFASSACPLSILFISPVFFSLLIFLICTNSIVFHVIKVGHK